MELAGILLFGLMLFMVAGSPLGRISPSALLAGSWAVIYLLQSFFAPDMASSFLATLTIFTITLSFAAGELIGCGGVNLVRQPRSTQARSSTEIGQKVNKEKWLRSLVILFGVLGLLGVVDYAYAMGILAATSFASLLLLPGIARVQMFSGALVIPLYSRVCVLFAYPGVILALAYYYLYRWRWWLILPMIVVLLFGMSQSGRAGTMIVLVQIVISIYLKNILVLKSNASKLFLRCAIVPGALMAVVFIGGQFLREGFNSVGTEAVTRVVYSLLGKYSFSSLFSALGIAPQVPGVYNFYSPIAPNGDTTNLYTAYRSFIDDYSIFGACLFYFAAGIFIAFLTRCILKGKSAFILVLIPLLSWLALSPAFSITYFDSFLLSCFLPYFLVQRSWSVSDGPNQIHLR
jgi:oligosaccharide repeat unit polymerase